MEIVIKDGNRIINWLFPRHMTLDKVLSFWQKGYYPFKRNTVRLNGKRLMEAHLDCKIGFFADKFDKLVFQVETVLPEKKEGEADKNG